MTYRTRWWAMVLTVTAPVGSIPTQVLQERLPGGPRDEYKTLGCIRALPLRLT